MINRIKENALLCFTLSLVVSYFACIGYYSFFKIDIASFLSIEDLTMIFAKYIWFSVALVLITVFGLYNLFSQIGTKHNWWDKTIGTTIIKRRALVVIPLVISVIVSAFIFKMVSYILSVIMGLGFGVIIVVVLITVVISSFKDKKQLSEITFKDWFKLFAATYFFILVIPLLCGSIAASGLSADKLKVAFDDGHYINTADSANLIYIGKTTDYFFINNKKNKATTAYRMDKVKSFEVTLSKE